MFMSSSSRSRNDGKNSLTVFNNSGACEIVTNYLWSASVTESSSRRASKTVSITQFSRLLIINSSISTHFSRGKYFFDSWYLLRISNVELQRVRFPTLAFSAVYWRSTAEGMRLEIMFMMSLIFWSKLLEWSLLSSRKYWTTKLKRWLQRPLNPQIKIPANRFLVAQLSEISASTF